MQRFSVSNSSTYKVLNLLKHNDVAPLDVVLQHFQKGADPWEHSQQADLLDLCLKDGRAAVLGAWVEAARRQALFPTPRSVSSPRKIHLVDLIASSLYLSRNARRIQLRNFVQKNSTIETQEEFLRHVVELRAPQGWQVVSNALLLNPDLHGTRVQHFPQALKFSTLHQSPLNSEGGSFAKIEDEFIQHAPTQILYNHISNKQHRLELDWRNNPLMLERLRQFLDPIWTSFWRDMGVVFHGSDNNNNNLLYHYLRSTPTAQLKVDAVEFLLEKGAQWKQLNLDGQSALELMHLHMESEDLPHDVQDLFEQQQLIINRFKAVGFKS